MLAMTARGWAGDGLAHEALLFETDDQLRARILPFAAQAVDAGQELVVVAGERVRTVVAEAFGAEAERLGTFVDADAQWAGGPQTMAWYQDSLAARLEAGRPWRLIAEPTWMAQPGGGVWSRYDAVVNEVFAAYPCYSLCVHDRRRVPSHLADEVRRVHPLVWDGSRTVPSPDYQPPQDFLRSVEPAWHPAPDDRSGAAVVQAREARSLVRAALSREVPELRADEVQLAVHELVVNALEAAGTAEVSHWREGEALVWEVCDDGPGLHDPAAGYVPPPRDTLGGRGLWLARSLADDAVVRPVGPGTAIRLYFRGL
jgi:anti-sigma regulatory factor (Ser/Thr protein kinase)